ncbi:hypothetical protein COP1_006616 [Malus domestica]
MGRSSTLHKWVLPTLLLSLSLHLAFRSPFLSFQTLDAAFTFTPSLRLPKLQRPSVSSVVKPGFDPICVSVSSKPSNFNDAVFASLPRRSWSLSQFSSDFKLRSWTSVLLVGSDEGTPATLAKMGTMITSSRRKKAVTITTMIHLNVSRHSFPIASRSDLSILERGLHGVEPVIIA